MDRNKIQWHTHTHKDAQKIIMLYANLKKLALANKADKG